MSTDTSTNTTQDTFIHVTVTTEEKKQITADVIAVLDASGSMGSMGSEPQDAINQFVKEQKELSQDPDARFSLYTFNTVVDKVFDNLPLNNIPEYTTYSAGGMTALFDSIGKAITDKLSTDRKENVVMMIITDGQENSSKEYITKGSIKKLIQKVETDHNWKVIFLGANIDAAQEGTSTGMSRGHCVQYTQNLTGDLMNAVRTTSKAASHYRRSAYTNVTPKTLDLSNMKSTSTM